MAEKTTTERAVCAVPGCGPFSAATNSPKYETRAAVLATSK